MYMKRYWIILLCILSISACAAKDLHVDGDPEETEHKRFPWMDLPLSHVAKDYRPSFKIDPEKPFLIMFGRGSGMDGLDTVEINEQGIVILYRLRYGQGWETCTIQLSPEDLKVIIDSIHTFQLIEMHKAYYADIHDGTQWVLWIKQEPHEKSVYCNNHFPENIYDFSDFLDGFLAEHGLKNATWTKVPKEDYRKHEEELWRSIR